MGFFFFFCLGDEGIDEGEKVGRGLWWGNLRAFREGARAVDTNDGWK